MMFLASLLFLIQAAPSEVSQEAIEIVKPIALDSNPITLLGQVCFNGLEAFPEEAIDQIKWTDFPSDLRFMNTYGHPGHFARTKTDSIQYVSTSKGPSHMGLGSTTLCAVGTQSLDYEEAVSQIAKKYGVAADKSPIEMNDMKVANMISDDGIFSVVSAKNGWVIIRKMDIHIQLSEKDAKKYIKPKTNE